MSITDNLKALVRNHIYAGARYAPDVEPTGRTFAVRLDNGTFPVIYSANMMQAPLGAANYIGRKLEHAPALFLLWFSWSVGPKLIRRISKAASIYRSRRPQHHFILLCNKELDQIAFTAAGLDAIFCNHNAFVDEQIFIPTQTTPIYDAIYNAALVSWKRHELSRSVQRCCLIFYERSDVGHKETMTYLAELEKTLPSHHFANRVVDDTVEKLSPSEVNALLGQSRCGLCLSPKEGAMLASIEYLLAGLPVVSTPSAGGRDAFADPECWLTVPDVAEAVSEGVREMINRNLSRDYVRAKTLGRVRAHRARLREAVARSTDGKAELPADLSDQTYRFLTDLTLWPPVSELETRLRLRT